MTQNLAALRDLAADLQTDAVYLHAMAQGVDALYDTIATDACPASNAMPAFLRSMIQWAEKLSSDVEKLETGLKGLDG